MDQHQTRTSNPPSDPLIDSYGRIHTSLRLSVTDRCNIRCTYCMPETNPKFFAREELLTFEELERVASLLVQRCGIRDIRITGGEPLVRKNLSELVAKLAGIPELKDLSLTTNGLLLRDHAEDLKRAGLQRLNISLDTLSGDTFKKITRREGLEQTLEGIEQAVKVGFSSIKLNALAIKGITEKEICRLVQYASAHGLTIRFIEYMPLDTDRAWQRENVLDGDQILSILKAKFGRVTPLERRESSQPAEEFKIGDQHVGIIRSITQPFCNQCNRLRITADGSLRNCLFAEDEVSFKQRLREGINDDQLVEMFRLSVAAKAAAHGINDSTFRQPNRPMYAIGG